MAGYVDTVDRHQICGWVYNEQNIDGDTKIIVSNEIDDETIGFSPHVFRRDVAELLHTSRCLGFALPLDIVPSDWSVVTLRDQHGKVIEHGDSINLGRRRPKSRQGKQALFLHIQKTAGTSVRTALFGGLRDCQKCFLYPSAGGMSVQRFQEIPLWQRQTFAFVGGHTFFGIHHHASPDARYFTFLRNPVSRAVSMYHHLAQLSDIAMVGDYTIPLRTVAHEGLTEEFDNYQTRILSGSPSDIVPIGAMTEEHADLALANIEASFAFVGLVETIDADFERLRKVLGVRTIDPIGLHNARPLAQGEPCRLDRRRLKLSNEVDDYLYERVARLVA